MQKTKKQLLGIAGLLVVGILTAIACAVPEAASAADQDEVGTDVQVVILSNASTLSVSSPKNNSTTTQPIVHVAYRYEKMSKITTTLEYKNDAGNTVRSVINTFTPENQEFGDNSFDLDLTQYGLKDREYKLVFDGQGTDGTPWNDSVVFSYRGIVVDPDPDDPNKPDPDDPNKPDPDNPDKPTDPDKPTQPEVKDPVIDVEISDKVDKVIVHVYDKNGNPVRDKDGNELVITVDRKDIDPETGKLLIKLPFGEYGVPEGDYKIIIIAKDKDGNIISSATTQVSYNPNPTKPETPDTPNTGSILGDLNISRADYLITGLVVFGLVAGFALYLISRKSRR